MKEDSLRILQLLQKPQRRGAEIFASQLSNQFKKRGNTVKNIYLYAFRGFEPLPVLNGDICFNANENSFSELFPGWNLKILQKLMGAIREFRPDVVQANAARTLKYGASIRMLDKNPSWILVYRNIGDPSFWVRGWTRKLFYRTFVLPKLDGIVAVSNNSMNVLRSFYGSQNTIVKIPRAVDADSFRATRSREAIREALGTPLTAKVLISVGNLSKEKRIDRLIRIVERQKANIPSLRLWIVGDGPLRKDLEGYAEAFGLESQIQFLGSQEDVASLLNAADLHVLTSDTEGIPGVVLEAALVGIPSVATGVGGLSDCILEGETGFLIDPQKENEFGEAVRLLLREPEKLEVMGKKARDWVLNNFSLDKISEDYLSLYKQLLRTKVVRRANS